MAVTMEEIIFCARELRASDIHISQGRELIFRIHGTLQVAPIQPTEEETRHLILSMMNGPVREQFSTGVDVDFAIQTSDGNRQRVNVFRYQDKIASTIRLLNNEIPSLEDLKLPKVFKELTEAPRGLILVTGPTGSGKSTSLAAMIQHINTTRAEHVLTIEDPIEYVYPKGKSLIHQREVGEDVGDFAIALRAALREDPDVILVGEMRDYETISAALTAAETGHLVMSTLHTTGAAQTIDRIIDACPTSSQGQIRTQLGSVLKAVITQCLIPTRDGNGRVAATEILVATDAASNMIRENKCHQLGSVMQSGSLYGMHTLNGDLSRLVRLGMITPENAFKYSNDKKDLENFM